VDKLTVDFERYSINGYPVCNVDVDDFSIHLIESSNKRTVVETVFTINSDHLSRLVRKENSLFNDAYLNSTYITQDSKVLAARILLSGHRVKVCSGADLVSKLFNIISIYKENKIIIVGGSDGDADFLSEKYNIGGSQLQQLLVPHGFLSDASNFEDVRKFLLANRVDIVLIAIGSPQQEILAEYLRKTVGYGVALICVGASIDFLTGKQRRAPKLFRACGMEWAWRFLSNPRRFAHRYLYSSPLALFRIKFDRMH